MTALRTYEMTTTEGNVSGYPDAGTLVGDSSTVFRDNSDATYCEGWRAIFYSFARIFAAFNQRADLPPVLDTKSTPTLYIRASCTSAAQVLQIEFRNNQVNIGAGALLPNISAAPTWYTIPVDLRGMSLATFVNYFRTPEEGGTPVTPDLEIVPYSGAHSDGNSWRIYELRLAFELPPVAGVPPLRQWPRDDGLGQLSSARRSWPPSRSRQRSLRRGRGSYL